MQPEDWVDEEWIEDPEDKKPEVRRSVLPEKVFRHRRECVETFS